MFSKLNKRLLDNRERRKVAIWLLRDQLYRDIERAHKHEAEFYQDFNYASRRARAEPKADRHWIKGFMAAQRSIRNRFTRILP